MLERIPPLCNLFLVMSSLLSFLSEGIDFESSSSDNKFSDRLSSLRELQWFILAETIIFLLRFKIFKLFWQSANSSKSILFNLLSTIDSYISLSGMRPSLQMKLWSRTSLPKFFGRSRGKSLRDLWLRSSSKRGSHCNFLVLSLDPLSSVTTFDMLYRLLWLRVKVGWWMTA